MIRPSGVSRTEGAADEHAAAIRLTPDTRPANHARRLTTLELSAISFQPSA
jgi:hypothetical protein